MKKLLAGLVLCAAICAPVYADDQDARVAASREAAKKLFGSLKAELEAAIAKGGPVSAITTCNERAPAITRQVSEAAGFVIRRTSLKLRNPANAPDAWERKILEQFEQRKAAGEDLKTMEHHETVEQNGQRTFRFMKAIPLAEMCVLCHGQALAPDLSAKLSEIYPEDQARGYRPNDLRGAFSVEQPL